MLGMVFTEFVEMVEESFSPELADDLLVSANLSHGGAYTAVGYYDFSEMLTLVTLLSERTGLPVPELLETFGRYLFHRLADGHQSMMKDQTDLFQLLSHLDDHIHPEVNKLYTDAKLPSFRVVTQTDSSIELDYTSERRLEALATGLIHGAAEYFNQPVTVNVHPSENHRCRFDIRLQN